MNDIEITETIKKAVIDAIAITGSQESLADIAGLSQGAISKYVRGDARPRGESAKRLENAVDKKIPKHRFAPHIFDEII